MWLIMRKPAVFMPSERATSMCCFAMSASVQWVAIRTMLAPAAWAAFRSCTVPIPGKRRVATSAWVTTSATAVIHSRSVWAPKP